MGQLANEKAGKGLKLILIRDLISHHDGVHFRNFASMKLQRVIYIT